MEFEMVWTAGAERDLVEIHHWLREALSEDDELVARVFRQPLRAALELLLQHPEIGARVKGAGNMRRLLLGPGRRYGLFYIVENRGIVIHALLDMRQNPEAIWKRLRGS
jgi:plasmid stabilization system protein ParE